MVSNFKSIGPIPFEKNMEGSLPSMMPSFKFSVHCLPKKPWKGPNPPWCRALKTEKTMEES